MTRHVILDDYFPSEMVSLVRDEWPANGDGWAQYSNAIEKKQALNDWSKMPKSCRDMLSAMLCIPAAKLLGIEDHLIPDTTLYGAGLHQHRRGEHLDVHLDADRHRWLGLERRCNAILFVTGWNKNWGGAFELFAPDMESWHLKVYPRFNRLLLFETTDHSFHGVPEPVMCPELVSRRTMACYWWGEPVSTKTKRPCAQFVARPGEPVDGEKDRLRRERTCKEP